MPKLNYQTGPVTSLGKEVSNQNATTHGGTSEKLILAGERREDFDALLGELLAEYAPVSTHDCGLVEDAAFARWFLWRKQRAYNAIEAAVYAAEPDQGKWSAETHHKLALADRYKTAAERALKRALNNLNALCKQSLQEARHQIAVQREARLAKKEEVLAELAIARASDALEERQQQKWKAVCNGFDVPTLVQKITVRITREGTATDMSPSNGALLCEADRELHPPLQVYRKLWFPGSMPAAYQTFPHAAKYAEQRDFGLEQLIPIDRWRAIVKKEEQLGTGHALLGGADGLAVCPREARP